MNAAILQRAMLGPSRLSIERARQLLPGLKDAMRRAQLNTVNRAAMFLAQVGEESGSLRYTEEIASGAEYEGRKDLGNTQPGDGVRFKGRTFIQITGRSNYTALSNWAHKQGIVPAADYFVTHPKQLASDEYVWLGPVWYWTVARSNLNALSDAGDIVGATRAINGGTNGLADRTNRWHHCLAIGDALLLAAPKPKPPAPQPKPAHEPNIDKARAALTEALKQHPKHGPVHRAVQAALNDLKGI